MPGRGDPACSTEQPCWAARLRERRKAANGLLQAHGRSGIPAAEHGVISAVRAQTAVDTSLAYSLPPWAAHSSRGTHWMRDSNAPLTAGRRAGSQPNPTPAHERERKKNNQPQNKLTMSPSAPSAAIVRHSSTMLPSKSQKVQAGARYIRPSTAERGQGGEAGHPFKNAWASGSRARGLLLLKVWLSHNTMVRGQHSPAEHD